jgi:membrane protein DedA with SNARE-associated domain
MRAMVPFICGYSLMKRSVFLKWNMLGGATWGALFVVISYVFKDAIERVIRYGGIFGIIAFLVFVVVILIYGKLVMQSKKKAKAKESVILKQDEKDNV